MIVSHRSKLFALLILLGFCAFPVSSRAQLANKMYSNQASPGYVEMRKVFSIVDLDGRAWVANQTVGIRLNEELASENSLPNPLIANEQIQYPREDPSYNNRFSSQINGGNAVVELITAANAQAMHIVNYQLQFFDHKGRRIGDVEEFSVDLESYSLRQPLTVPIHTILTPGMWILVAIAMLLLIGLVTFGIYRPFYTWRLSRGATVDKARDWALFLWWFLILGGYGFLLWLSLPRSLPFWIICGLLGLMLILRFIMCLKPRVQYE